jgi:ubiquinone/menaquinone biosynthesis C-methylase UbiE
LSTIAYHLKEMGIASRPEDPRHILPVLPAHCRRVLDVGCGIGQTLLHLEVPERHGVDVDREAIEYGRSHHPELRLRVAAGERLPFEDEVFDAVLCRVALPYMEIPSALREFARVLRPGGWLWLALHGAGQWARSVSREIGDVRSWAYHAYILLHSVSLHALGMSFRYPLRPARCESFQTVSGIRRAMRRAGFVPEHVPHGRGFVVTAVRR